MKKFCQKVAFNTKKDALSTLNHMKLQSRKRKKLPKRAYFCEPCQGWHITSQEKNDIVTYEFHLPEDKEIVEKINDILK